MPGKQYGEAHRNFRLCVDSYEQGVLSGRLYRPGVTKDCIRFHSLMQLLSEMEQILEEAGFPQSFTAKRSFLPLPDTPLNARPEDQDQTGERATFLLRLLFRQNASWQGTVTWLEGKNEETFRSVLELALLMDSALGGCRTASGE